MWRVFFVLFFAGISSNDADAQARRRLTLDVTEIEGKVAKPEVTMFITRQNLGKGFELELRESFVPKIIESVEKKPF